MPNVRGFVNLLDVRRSTRSSPPSHPTLTPLGVLPPSARIALRDLDSSASDSLGNRARVGNLGDRNSNRRLRGPQESETDKLERSTLPRRYFHRCCQVMHNTAASGAAATF
jgi:hypothetical protein